MQVSDEPEARPRDGMQVHLENPEDVAYWMQRLGCTAAQLGVAVKVVGPLGDRVEAWLKRARPSANDP